MDQTAQKVNVFEELKAAHVIAEPGTITEKVASWAFEDAEDMETVIGRLESLDCAACHSPAPIYNTDMAREMVEHWPEIDCALDDYRDAIGEAWTPKPDQSFLTYLWFTYEWTARNLADAIRDETAAAE